MKKKQTYKKNTSKRKNKIVEKVAYENILPLSSALLTVENYSQALERSDKKKKNLGGLAAKTCLNLIKKINE